MEKIDYMLILIIVLVIFNIFCLIKLYNMKNQVKQILFQIKKINDGKLNIISIPLINKEIIKLSSEINNLIDDKNDLKNKLLNHEEDLKKSIADISHDFRTPLTSILGYIQLLEKDDLTKSEKENLDVVKSKALYLEKLIEEFFELSVLDSKNVEPDNVKINITNFLSNTIIENVQLIEKAGIDVKIDIPDKSLFICSDKVMLKRVIENLISNALRYSSEDIRIYLKESTDIITIEIGNSIIEESVDTEKIFSRFYKGDKSRNSKGTGLGLAVAKMLCDKIGAQISAVSTDHQVKMSVDLKKINQNFLKK